MPQSAPQSTITRRDAGSDPGATVALLVMDVGNPFYAGVARGAEDAASETGHPLFLGNSDDSADKERRYLEILDRHEVGGVVISPMRDDLGYLDLFWERGIEIVMLERQGGEDHCSVSVDDRKGGGFAVRHLASLGHERIALVYGPPTGAATARCEGAREAAAAAGLPDDAIVEVRVGGYDMEAGLAAGDVVADADVTAAFCINDLLAAGVMNRVQQQGRSVPGDLAIVGYDDIPLAELLPTPLTTVRQPMYGLGHTAMRLLIDEIENPERHVHQQKVFTPTLVVRASSGAADDGS